MKKVLYKFPGPLSLSCLVVGISTLFGCSEIEVHRDATAAPADAVEGSAHSPIDAEAPADGGNWRDTGSESAGGGGPVSLAASTTPTFRAAGPGCPAGTVTLVPDDRGKRLRAKFSRFAATLPSSSEGVSAEARCVLYLPVGLDGQTYAVRKVTLRGQATLGKDTSAVFSVLPSVVGRAATTEDGNSIERLVRLPGPHSDAFSVEDEFVQERLSFIPCSLQQGRQLMLDVTTWLESATEDAAARVDVHELDIAIASKGCPATVAR